MKLSASPFQDLSFASKTKGLPQSILFSSKELQFAHDKKSFPFPLQPIFSIQTISQFYPRLPFDFCKDHRYLFSVVHYLF